VGSTDPRQVELPQDAETVKLVGGDVEGEATRRGLVSADGSPAKPGGGGEAREQGEGRLADRPVLGEQGSRRTPFEVRRRGVEVLVEPVELTLVPPSGRRSSPASLRAVCPEATCRRVTKCGKL